MLVRFTLDEIKLLEGRLRHDIQRIDQFTEEHDIKSSVTMSMINSAKQRREKILTKLKTYKDELY